jgi:hypothetical protein
MDCGGEAVEVAHAQVGRRTNADCVLGSLYVAASSMRGQFQELVGQEGVH